MITFSYYILTHVIYFFIDSQLNQLDAVSNQVVGAENTYEIIYRQEQV